MDATVVSGLVDHSHGRGYNEVHMPTADHFLAISSSLLAVNEVKMCSTRAERKNPGRVLRPDDSGIAVHTII